MFKTAVMVKMTSLYYLLVRDLPSNSEGTIYRPALRERREKANELYAVLSSYQRKVQDCEVITEVSAIPM